MVRRRSLHVEPEGQGLLVNQNDVDINSKCASWQRLQRWVRDNGLTALADFHLDSDAFPLVTNENAEPVVSVDGFAFHPRYESHGIQSNLLVVVSTPVGEEHTSFQVHLQDWSDENPLETETFRFAASHSASEVMGRLAPAISDYNTRLDQRNAGRLHPRQLPVLQSDNLSLAQNVRV